MAAQISKQRLYKLFTCLTAAYLIFSDERLTAEEKRYQDPADIIVGLEPGRST